MTHSVKPILLTALVLLPALPAQAQDRPDRAARLAEVLDLTDAQTRLVTDAEPGDLWALAADLTPTLTDEQKERLFARPEGPMRGERMHGRDGRMSDEARAERREAMQERHAERTEAMREALDLTDAQVQQFDALRAERQAEREQRRADRDARRTDRDERQAEVAAILTPEQQEVTRVHRALAARLMHARHHRAHRR